MLRRALLLFASFAFFCFAAQAQEKKDDLKISTEFSVNVWSDYVLTNGFRLSDQIVVQPDLTLYANDFSLDVWSSFGAQSKFNSGYDDEVDLTLAWDHDFEKWHLKTGASYFEIYRLNNFGAGDVVTPFVQASRDVFSIGEAKFSAKLRLDSYYEIQSKTGTRGDLLATLGLVGRRQFSESGLSSHAGVNLLWDEGGFGLDQGFLGIYQAGVTLPLSKWATWNILEVKLPFGITIHDVRRTDSRLAVMMGISFSF